MTFPIEFPDDMKKCPSKFRAGQHVHEWIVDAVEHEEIAQIRADMQNSVAIGF